MRGLTMWAVKLALAAAARLIVWGIPGLYLAVGILLAGNLALLAQLVLIIIKRRRHD